MNPVKTLCFTLSLVALLAASVAAQTLYFYPPDDGKWIAGRSYISQGDKASAVPLSVDSTKCGWYKTSAITDDLKRYAQFWLGKPGIDRIAPNGRLIADFDSSVTRFEDEGTTFKLGDIFAAFGGRDIYFVADNLDEPNPVNAQYPGWSTSAPAGTDDPTRCKWTLAAFIYDTDKSVNTSFEEHTIDRNSGTGVRKNMAKADLNPTTRKIECADCTAKGANANVAGMFKSEQDFTDAFRDYPRGTSGAKNAKLCYDMPFTQTSSGSFEFDSDKLRQDGTADGKNTSSRLVGGFFPKVLDDAALRNAAVVDGYSNYTDCPSCATKRKAESFAPTYPTNANPATNAVNPWCFNRGYATGNNKTCSLTSCRATNPNISINDCIVSCCGQAYPAGYFIDGDNPNNVWDWGARDKVEWYLWGSTKILGNESTTANEHFCFESHAEFFYDPDQEFLFRGDDDIWVYINNKLVIDLGGTHLAAPGSVRLNTLGLTEGQLYPIDIFFCDRRTTMSNVLINTNMYVMQKSAFTQNPENTYNEMCAAIQGGADCASKMNIKGGDNDANKPRCGSDLIKADLVVDFYMVNRVTKDTVYLSPKRGNNPSTTRLDGCVDQGLNKFSCRSTSAQTGIIVDEAVYKCGGRFACRGNAPAIERSGIIGSFNVYARLMTKDGKPVEGAKVLLIDSFKGESNSRVVWTKATSNTATYNLKDEYGRDAAQRQNAVAGKWVPVYISAGSWDPGLTSFEINDEDGPGTAYTLTISGGSGLTIYKTKGGSPIGTNSASGTIPATGIDTLWVKADYDIGDNKEFTLNVAQGAPAMTLIIRQPTLEFRESATSTAKVNPSGYAKWGTGGKPPVIGDPLDVYIVAIDPVSNDICTHCTFTLNEKQTKTEGTTCKAGMAKPIVRGDKLVLEGGKLNTNMRGYDETGEAGCTATWVIVGESPETSAQWNLLRFRESPTPIPINNSIFDRNGDGIGDKVKIGFNKSLKSHGDSLYPVLVEVEWEKGNIKYFHIDGYGTPAQLQETDYVKGLYKNASFLTANAAWWRANFIADSDTSLLVIQKPDDIKFSRDIKTSGTGTVKAWIPYINNECVGGNCTVDNAFSYSAAGYDLKDSISPIIVKAEYVYDKNNKGGCEANSTCRESFTVWLSEPVFAGPDASDDLVKNPFSYCLGRSQGNLSCQTSKISVDERQRQDYDNFSWGWELPNTESFAYSASYKQNKLLNAMAQPGAAKGDSVIELTYYANGTNGSVHSPKADDWVKLRGRNDAKVFQDAEGNVFNPRERGVMVTGTNPAKKKPIHISQVKPNSPSVGGTFDGSRPDDGYLPDWIGSDGMNYGKNNLFRPGDVTEFLPVPKKITDPKIVMQYYPNSVGTLFDIADKFHNQVGTFINVPDGEEPKYYVPRDGNINNGDPNNMEQLTDANVANFVNLKASAYYHTNLGNYTAHRDPITTKCTAEIFKDENNAGNCYTNEYNYYLAWDLKDNKGRAVGAGAYVGISKFWMELSYYEKDKNGNFKKKTKKLSEQEFIEMFGVKRTGK